MNFTKPIPIYFFTFTSKRMNLHGSKLFFSFGWYKNVKGSSLSAKSHEKRRIVYFFLSFVTDERIQIVETLGFNLPLPFCITGLFPDSE